MPLTQPRRFREYIGNCFSNSSSWNWFRTAWGLLAIVLVFVRIPSFVARLWYFWIVGALIIILLCGFHGAWRLLLAERKEWAIEKDRLNVHIKELERKAVPRQEYEHYQRTKELNLRREINIRRTLESDKSRTWSESELGSGTEESRECLWQLMSIGQAHPVGKGLWRWGENPAK